MGIREDIEKETSEEIARRLIFDGRVSDEDIAAGCGIAPERVQELISEVAHETRELLQELRKMLFDIRKPELSDEDRRDILLQIVMLLRLMIDNEVCEEPGTGRDSRLYQVSRRRRCQVDTAADLSRE